MVYNIGLSYVAASLIEEGHDVEVLDIEGYRYSKKEVLDIIRDYDCDIIGLGTLITAYKYLKWLVPEIRRIKPDIPLILGNSIGSTIPEIILNEMPIDVVVIGEGEITIKELVKAIESKKDLSTINGIAFKKNGKVIITPERELIKDIDSIPLPRWDLFPLKIYMGNFGHSFRRQFLKPPIFFLNTARGCPYHCTYCYHPFKNKKIRLNSAEWIVDVLKHLKQEYKINSFLLADDLSITNKKRMIKLCDLLIEEKLNLDWSATGRVNLVTEELLVKMKSAGCKVIGFGIESGSQKILDNIKKQVKVNQAAKAILLCKKVGIYPSCSFMIGNVGETRETVFESVEFIKKYIDKLTSFFITTPYPETELFDYAEEHGLITDKVKLFERYGEQGSQLLVNFTDMTDDELWALKLEAERAIVRNYLKIYPGKIPLYLFNRFRGLIRAVNNQLKLYDVKTLIYKIPQFLHRIKLKIISIIKRLIQ